MISSTKSAMTTAALMVALLVMTSRTAEAQSDCVAKLVTCADSLNSTRPAASCCDAIREVVSTQLPCLCNLYNNPSLLGGLNITQALELPKHCNLSADTSVCRGASSPNSSPVPPSGVPGGDNGNGVDKSVLSLGASSLFLLFTVVMFH